MHTHAPGKNARLAGQAGAQYFRNFQINRKIYRYIYGYNIKYYDFPAS